MKDVTLPVSITVDVCWHQGRIAVARHSGAELVVELWTPDLTDHHSEFTAPMAGNAGARVHSFQGVLWLAFRDASDRGHLVRLDTRETQDLTPFFNAGRPFAFGDGHCAWQTAVSAASVVALGQPLHTARTVTFPDFIPTGLSHIANGEVFSWESQRLLRSFAVGFASRPPFVIGEDFDDRGLVGEIDGRQGHLLLWRENQMRDPRVDVNGDRAAVVAWATGGNARLGIVTAADLVTVAPPPPPPSPPDPQPLPPEPVMDFPIPDALKDQRALVTEVRNTLYPDMIGRPLNDPARAFQITKHVAWRLRAHGVGLVKAKPGSANNVEGFTNDIVALSNGAHWDVLIGGDGDAFPSWSLVEEQHWPAIVSRWTPAVDPAGDGPDPPRDDDQPEPSLQLPENVRALLIQFAQRFPLPQMPGGGEEQENKCRAWCTKFAEQVRFSTNDEAWGVKRAAEGRPQSKDTITKHLGGGRLAIFNLMLGAGTGAPTLVEHPRGEVSSDQVFIPVHAVNHLGGPPPEPPAALTDAQKAAVNKLIAAALAPLKADVARLREEVEGLKAGQT